MSVNNISYLPSYAIDGVLMSYVSVDSKERQKYSAFQLTIPV
jgi:hypothetical protein